MALNLGYKTKQLIIGGTSNMRLTNDTYDNLINSSGIPIGTVYRGAGATGSTIQEMEFIDLGIITDENEDLTAGGIAVSVPTAGAQNRYDWSIGGRVLRVTISGIIPDGIYVADPSDPYYGILNGKSNASVFRYKINKIFAYTSLFGEDNTFKPCTVQYRRYYIDEKGRRNSSSLADAWTSDYTSEIGSYVVTNYHMALIKGTRHVQYTMTLDFANDSAGLLKSGGLDVSVTNPDTNTYIEGIYPREEGDM